jgi:hypothetical protein
MKGNTIIVGLLSGFGCVLGAWLEVILQRSGFVHDQVGPAAASGRPGGQQLHRRLWGATAVEKRQINQELPYSRLGELYTLLRSLFSDIFVTQSPWMCHRVVAKMSFFRPRDVTITCECASVF